VLAAVQRACGKVEAGPKRHRSSPLERLAEGSRRPGNLPLRGKSDPLLRV